MMLYIVLVQSAKLTNKKTLNLW